MVHSRTRRSKRQTCAASTTSDCRYLFCTLVQLTPEKMSSGRILASASSLYTLQRKMFFARPDDPLPEMRTRTFIICLIQGSQLDTTVRFCVVDNRIRCECILHLRLKHYFRRTEKASQPWWRRACLSCACLCSSVDETYSMFYLSEKCLT